MPTTHTTADWRRTDIWGPPIRKRWAGKDILKAVAWLIILNVLASIPAIVMLRASPDQAMSIIYNPLVLAGGMIALWGVFWLYPIYATYAKGRRSLRRDFGWSFTRRDVVVGLALGLLLRAFDVGLGQVASRFIDMSDGDNSSWLTLPRPWAWTAFFVIGAAVIAPALEELFFRGFLLRAIARIKRIPRAWRANTALIGSSVLFGLMHITGATAGGLYVVVVTGTLGALLAYMRVKTRRLGLPVVVHIVFNTTGVILALNM